MSNRYSTIAVLGLAVLLFQACHKSPTAPELPEVADSGVAVSTSSSAKGGKGGGGGPSATGSVSMSGGMLGGSQSIDIEKDGDRELRLSGPYVNSINMTETHSACYDENDPQSIRQLVDLLKDGPQERFRMVMVVDRTGGGDDRLSLNFEDEDLGHIVFGVKDGVNVVETSDVFEFSAGSGNVRIQHRIGKPKDNVTVICPNLDSVTVTLVRD